MTRHPIKKLVEETFIKKENHKSTMKRSNEEIGKLERKLTSLRNKKKRSRNDLKKHEEEFTEMFKEKDLVKEFYKLYKENYTDKDKESMYNYACGLLPGCDKCGLKFYSPINNQSPNELNGKNYCKKCFETRQ